MAKKKVSLDELDSFDLDAELAKLDGFGESEAEPPKNAREVITRSLKDVGKGVKDELKVNTTNAKKFLQAAVPNSLRTEYSDLSDAIYGEGGIKETITKGLDDVKKAGKDFHQTLKEMLPKDGKMSKTVDKIAKFLKLDDEASLEDRLKANNDMLMEGLKSELQESFTRESTLALLQSGMQQKQNKNMLEHLASVGDSLNTIKTFHIEVTNNFYRKSLEMQYKSLFTQRQHLELSEKMFNTFKIQYETIVRNTALPEFVKLQRSEAFFAEARRNMDQSLQKYLFNDVSAIKKLKTNITRRLKYGFENFIQGLGAVSQAGGMLGTMGGDGMSPSKSFMAGSMISGGVRDFFAKQVGERLARTKFGKKAVFGIKNFFADPSGWAANQLDKSQNSPEPTSKIGKFFKGLKDNILGEVAQAGAVGGDWRGNIYGKENPMSAAIFDNRAHTSLVKIIPGLLNKIYGEVKSARDGSAPDSNELVYDYTRQGLFKKNDFINNFKADYKTKVMTRNSANLSSLLGMYRRYGKFTATELDVIGSTIMSYIIRPDAKLNPTMMLTESYVNMFPGDLRTRILKAGKKIIAAAVDDSNLNAIIIDVLVNLRKNMPSLEDEIDMLYMTGNANMGVEMGLLTRDNYTQSYSTNIEGARQFMRNSAKNMGISVGDYDSVSMSGDPTKAGFFKQYKKEMNKLYNKGRKGVDKLYKKGKKRYDKFAGSPRTKKTMDKLREDFFKSEEYISGKVKDFPTWLGALTGYNQEAMKELLSKDNIKEQTDKAADYVSDKTDSIVEEGKAIVKDVGNMIMGKKPNLEELRAQFFNSPEYQSGAVTEFPEWLKAQGLGPDGQGSRLWAVLRRTWALDRKIAGGLLKWPFKLGWGAAKLGIGGTWGLAKRGFMPALKGAGLVAGALPMQMINAVSTMFGGQPIFNGPGTWGLDRKMSAGTLKGSTTAAAKAPGVIGRTIGGLKNFVGAAMKWGLGNRGKLTEAAEQAGTKIDTTILAAGLDAINTQLQSMRPKKKVNPFDKDGDGKREGSWIDRLNFFKKKNKDDPGDDKKRKGLVEFMKENKGLTLMGGLMLISGLLKSMGFTMEDVKAGVKNTVEAVKTVGNIIGKVIGGLWNAGKSIANFVTSPIDTVKSWFTGEDPNKQPVLDANGQPVMGPDGKPLMEDKPTSTAEIVGGTTAVLGGVYAAKKAAGYVIRHPIKTIGAVIKAPVEAVKAVSNASLTAAELFNKIKTYVSNKSKVLGWVFGWCGETIMKILDKLYNMAKTAKRWLKICKEVAFRLASKVGEAIAKKVGIKLGQYALAFTGFGAILTIGFAIWDLAWVLYYIYDGYEWWEALLKQFLGVDPKSKEVKDAVKEAEKAVADEEANEEKAKKGGARPISEADAGLDADERSTLMQQAQMYEPYMSSSIAGSCYSDFINENGEVTSALDFAKLQRYVDEGRTKAHAKIKSEGTKSVDPKTGAVTYTSKEGTNAKKPGQIDLTRPQQAAGEANKVITTSAAIQNITTKMESFNKLTGGKILPAVGVIGRLGTDATSTLIRSQKGSMVGASPGIRSAGDHVDFANLHPELKRRVNLMADEYLARTGKQMQMNSGKRSMAMQADLKRRKPKLAASPRPTSPHIAGYGIDFNTGDLNKAEQLGLFEKYGLYRPFWPRNKHGGKLKESWHLEMLGIRTNSGPNMKALAALGPLPHVDAFGGSGQPANQEALEDEGVTSPNGDKPQDTQTTANQGTGGSGELMNLAASGTTNVSSVNSAPGLLDYQANGSGGTSSSISSSYGGTGGTSAATYASTAPATPMTASTTTYADTSSYGGGSASGMGGVSDILQQQLRVQMNMAESLVQLVQLGGGTANTLPGNPTGDPKAEAHGVPSTPPPPAVNLKRNTYSL